VQPVQISLFAPPQGVALRDWIIYRSSLNPAEVAYLVDSSYILQASLEVYAPLHANSINDNFAQSMSTLQLVLNGSADESRTSEYVAVGLFIGVLSLGCLAISKIFERNPVWQTIIKAQ